MFPALSPVNVDPIVLLAIVDLPSLGIHRHDRVVFDPTRSAFPSLVRGFLTIDLVNTGGILGAFSDGALAPLTPIPDSFLECAG